jgi:hypothetical protein
MSKSNPFRKQPVINGKTVTKITPKSTPESTPESTLTLNNGYDNVFINENIDTDSRDTNILTPPKQIQKDVFSIIENFEFVTTFNVQYIDFLRYKVDKNKDLNTFLENFNKKYINTINFDENIINTFILIILFSSPIDFQLIRNVLFMSHYINVYKLNNNNKTINTILNYFKGNLIFLILINFDYKIIKHLKEEIVINTIISIYRIKNDFFLNLLIKKDLLLKEVYDDDKKKNNDKVFETINDLIMKKNRNYNFTKNFTNLKDKMKNFFCGYKQTIFSNFDIVNKDYLLDFLKDDNIINFCNEKNKNYKLFNIINNDIAEYDILPNDKNKIKKKIATDKRYRYIDLDKINNIIIKEICSIGDNKKLFYHFFLEIIVNHLFFDYFNDLKSLNKYIIDDDLLLFFYINLNKFFEWVVKNDEDKLCFPGIQSLINNKTQENGGKQKNKTHKKTKRNKRKQIKTKKHYNKTKE